jgi:hydroxyacylglutathione hydrolase
MQIQIIPVTLFQSNCAIVWDEESMEGIVVDPGGEPERVRRFLEDQGITVKGIFLTHGHVDHVSGTNKLKEATGAEAWLHEADLPLAERTAQQCLMFGIPMEQAPVVEHGLEDGATFTFGALAFEVLHTPGHSPGSCCLYFADADEPLLLAGDLLFAGSIGRMDLPGGDQQKMKNSLDRVAALPDGVTVVPGHGPSTTIGREKRQNPYLTGGIYAW